MDSLEQINSQIHAKSQLIFDKLDKSITKIEQILDK